MSFNDCDEAMAGGMFLQLAEDGDEAKVVFVGEPVPREGTFKNKPRRQYCFPVVKAEGVGVWTVGVRLYKRLRDNWKVFGRAAVKIVRHGVKDDQFTKYDLTPCAIPAALKKIIADIEDGEIDQLLTSLEGVGGDGEVIPV